MGLLEVSVGVGGAGSWRFWPPTLALFEFDVPLFCIGGADRVGTHGMPAASDGRRAEPYADVQTRTRCRAFS